jgi:ABC-type transport system involved in multi-copper enzyme maturation permease subunit
MIPSLGDATSVYFGMTWTRLKRGRLLWVCGALYALPVLGAIALVAAGHFGRGLFDNLAEIYFRFLIPFVPALLASPAIAEEIDSRTFTFVFARPAPRPALVLGKYAAAVGPAALGAMVSMGLVWLIALIRFPQDYADTLGHLARAEAAALLGVLVFASLAIAIGSMFTRHPFVGTMGYLLLVEAGLASAPIVLNLISQSWHLRNLAELPVPGVGFMVIHVPAWVSAAVPAVMSVVCLGLASLSVSGAEYHQKS